MAKDKVDVLFPAIAHEKKRAFLAAYCEVGTALRAAEAAGVSRRSHWNWMHDDSPEGKQYQAAFAEATKMASDRLEQEAWRRAREGVKRLKFYKGEPIIDPETNEPYFEHEYSDVLLIFLMKGAMPEKYREKVEHSGPGGGVIPIGVQVLQDRDWYGNSDRLLANANEAATSDPIEPSTIQTGGVREEVRKNGHRANGSAAGPRPDEGDVQGGD